MDTKHTKHSGVTFFALAFMVALLFELYFIFNDPTNYFMLIGVGIILIITGYLTFDSMERARIAKNKAIAEQNDLMIKAGKAIYLATKRNSQEAQKQHAQNIKAIEYMVNKLVSNEKDMVNILIAKNEEIASKQIPMSTSNEGPSMDMTALVDQLTASNAMLAKEIQSAITVNELVKANADLVKNVKEVLNSTSNLSKDVLAPYVSTSTTEMNDAGNSQANISYANNVNDITNNVVTDNIVANNIVTDNTVPNDAIANEEVADAATTDDNFTDINADDIDISFDDSSYTETFNIEDIANSSEAAILAAATNENLFNDSSDNISEGSDANFNDVTDGYDAKTEDEFAFETFDIADNTSNSIFETDEPVFVQDIVDDINISALNDMVEEEGSVIAPAISEALDEEMSQGEAESVLSVLNGDTNRQLTDSEIAALFANI